MTEREQFDFLLKIGYDVKTAAELIKKMTDQQPDALVKEEPEQISIDKQEQKQEEKSEENPLEKQIEELKAEIKELRESTHKLNREKGVINTDIEKPKTVDESVEEILKSLEA